MSGGLRDGEDGALGDVETAGDDSATRGAGLALAGIGAYAGLLGAVSIGVVVALEIGIGIGLSQQKLKPVDATDVPALFEMRQFPHTGSLWQIAAIGAVLLGWMGVALARRSGDWRLGGRAVPLSIAVPLAIATVGGAVTYADGLGAISWLVMRLAQPHNFDEATWDVYTGLGAVAASVPVAALLFRFTR